LPTTQAVARPTRPQTLAADDERASGGAIGPRAAPASVERQQRRTQQPRAAVSPIDRRPVTGAVAPAPSALRLSPTPGTPSGAGSWQHPWQHPDRPIRPYRPRAGTIRTIWHATDVYDSRVTRLRAWSGITGWRFESSSAHVAKAPRGGAFSLVGTGSPGWGRVSRGNAFGNWGRVCPQSAPTLKESGMGVHYRKAHQPRRATAPRGSTSRAPR
jgi:hypothetical protein